MRCHGGDFNQQIQDPCFKRVKGINVLIRVFEFLIYMTKYLRRHEDTFFLMQLKFGICTKCVTLFSFSCKDLSKLATLSCVCPVSSLVVFNLVEVNSRARHGRLHSSNVYSHSVDYWRSWFSRLRGSQLIQFLYSASIIYSNMLDLLFALHYH